MNIWKFPLQITARQSVHMPQGVQILSAQMQGEILCLWALVNPDAPMQWREIEILGTGNYAPEVARRFISTAQMCDGAMVCHVFELL